MGGGCSVRGGARGHWWRERCERADLSAVEAGEHGHARARFNDCTLLELRAWGAGDLRRLRWLDAPSDAVRQRVAMLLLQLEAKGVKFDIMKSRPGFRPLLGERMEVIVPPSHYDKVDF